MHVWNVLHAARCKYGTQKWRKNRHLRSIAQLCPAMIIFIHQYQNNCPHNMMNFCLVTAEIDWWILGTPANFNGFRVLASLLHRSHSTEVNQTLHDVWQSPGLVHYIYIHFWHHLPRNSILPGAYFTLRPSLVLSYIDSVTAQHSSTGHQPNFATWYLHATGWPSRSTLGGRTF